MIRLIVVASFTLAVAASAQAMTRAPLQPDGLITPVAEGCGPGMVRVAGVCVARAGVRQERRCMRWTGGVCALWQ
jgi:hypothetical protein